jgi:hypothetical protein
MKDKKIKYDLSYFMTKGGKKKHRSPPPPNPNWNNRNGNNPNGNNPIGNNPNPFTPAEERKFAARVAYYPAWVTGESNRVRYNNAI